MNVMNAKKDLAIPFNNHDGFSFFHQEEMLYLSLPNQLLLWSMVKYCINHGIIQIDLGECVPGTGVHNFKLWFGAQTKEIYRYSSKRFNFDKVKFSKNKYCEWDHIY